MNSWGIIYEYSDANDNTVVVVAPALPTPGSPTRWTRALNSLYSFNLRSLAGFAFLAIGIGGTLGPMIPAIRMETSYAVKRFATRNAQPITRNLPASVPVILEPLKTPDGTIIEPASQDFAIVIPKINVNSAVMTGVDPASPDTYAGALEAGVAHASTSFLPDENGTVYLFSHSTNYDWFVKDLNAVFYLMKNLENGDLVILIYKGKRYTYRITDKQVVAPKSTGYLYPSVGQKNLILQTCWPPGSTTQRLLIFAELIEEDSKQI